MKILIVDDNPDHRELIVGRLRKAFPEAVLEDVGRASDWDAAFARCDFDIVLTDYRLNWTDGLAILRQVQTAMPHMPVIMVTETGSEEVAAEGMKAGLSDYVLKSHLNRLPLAVRESLEKARLRHEREQALERLRISEERYRAVSELSSDYAYAFRVEPDGAFVREWVTNAYERITGFTAAELDAGVLLPLVHVDDRPRLESSRARLLAGEPQICELRILNREGNVRWLRDSARPVWDAVAGRVVRVYGAGQDITEQKRAEQARAQLISEQTGRAALEASEKRYRSLAEAIPQIVWTATPQGRVDYRNRRWFEFTGLDEEQSYASDGWCAALHPEDVGRATESWSQAIARGETYEVECRIRRASDNTYRWHITRAVPLKDTDGTVVKWLGTSTDIDDQKRSGEALRESQKLESIGLLAGGIAHDFNNLLTGILGNTSLALEDLPARHPVRSMLESVVLASERAADLTQQLLAYSGKGQFFVQPLDISKLVREISSLLRSSISKKVELRLDLDEGLPLVEADSAQLQQLIMNMVINGAEAIGEDRSGTVAVVTGRQEVDEAYLKRRSFAANGIAPGTYVCIEVHDNGCGMDEETQRRVFEPFFTTKFTGRGLGLAAALGIVRSHRGAIQVQSAPGQGTSFNVLFPALDARQPEPAPQHAGTQALSGQGCILVADDEEIVRRTARAALERYGYRVVTAENGQEAVEAFRRLHDRLTAVLLDMTMPVMSGEEALPLLKSISEEVPVIASSGYNEAFAVERFAGRGLAGFVQKPYTAATLARTVKTILESPRTLTASEQ